MALIRTAWLSVSLALCACGASRGTGLGAERPRNARSIRCLATVGDVGGGASRAVQFDVEPGRRVTRTVSASEVRCDFAAECGSDGIVIDESVACHGARGAQQAARDDMGLVSITAEDVYSVRLECDWAELIRVDPS